MIWLKQSATADALLGPFVDDTDFKTAETALTIAQADIRLSKNGGVFAQTNNVAGATHRENGHYLIPLDATDTNTLGRLRVVVNEAGALQVWQDFMVVPANVWDSLFGADKLQVDAVEYVSTAQTARDLGAQLDATVSSRAPEAGGNVAAIKAKTDQLVFTIANKVDSSIQAAGDFAQAAADKVWASASRTLTAFSTALAVAVWDVLETAIAAASSIGLKVKTNLDATVASRAPEAGGNVAAIKAKTDQLAFTIANKVDSSIQAAGDFAQAAADKVWASASRTLTAFSTALALSVWDVLESAIATASSIGLKLKNNLDAAISSRPAAADYTAARAVKLDQLDAAVSSRATPAQVNAEVVDALTVDTYAEPGQEAPPATTTLVKKIGYLFKVFRNRFTQDATTAKLYADDALTVDQKATVSDNGTTFDRGEMGGGP